MHGRRVSPARRWIARSLAGLAAIAAVTFVFATPSAASSTVTVTMTVTGASVSNCSTTVGGSDIYIKPDDTLKFRTDLVSISLLGIQIPGLVSITDLSGQLSIVGGPSPRIDSLTATTVTPLSPGDHKYTFDLDTVTVTTPLLSKSVSLTGPYVGVTLHYEGVIHVTSEAAGCGIAVQVPGPVVTVGSATVSVPPVKVSVPVPATTTPHASTSTSTATTNTSSTAGPSTTTTPLPAGVIPGGSSGGFPGVRPDATSPDGLNGLVSLVAATTSPDAVSGGTHGGTGRDDLAVDNPGVASRPTLLAILAIMALATVTGSSARYYLLRRAAVPAPFVT